MLAVVQAVSAAVGAVSRKGLEDCIRDRYGKLWALVAMASIVIVGILTLAADLEGGAAALDVMLNIDYRWFILPFAAAVAALLIWGRYQTIENILKYVALVFFAYAVSAIVAKPDWLDVLRHTIVPHWHWNTAYVGGVVALLGTTLTAYAYTWETIEVSHERPPLRRLGLVQADAALGVVFAGVSFFFIVICCGATLGVHHHPVETARDAAVALRPVAGHYAALLFGIGLLASAVLAVPVLAGTNAYVIAEMFGWRASLDSRFARAPAFYVTLVLSLCVATAIAYAGIPPIRILFASSIAGGLATPITLTLMILVAADRTTMHRHRVRGWLLAAAWAVDAIVTTACGIFLYQVFTGTS